MRPDHAIVRLRQYMRPRVGLHVSMTLFLAAFAGAAMLQALTTFAALCGGGAVLVWVWYVRRCQRARDMVDDAIAAVGEEALADDFAHAQPYEYDLRLGRLMAYQLKDGLMLPLSALRQLHMEDSRSSVPGSNRSEPVTCIFCEDESGRRRHLVTLRLHSAHFEPLLTQLLTDVPLCALLYEERNDVAPFASQLCVTLCREHPEAGFIRQHDAEKQHYGLSRTLLPGFVPMP